MAAKKTLPPGPDAAAEPVVPSEPGGWFRNTTVGELTVIGQPTTVIPPGEARWLPYTPTHWGLEPAGESEPVIIPALAPEPSPAPDMPADPAPLPEE